MHRDQRALGDEAVEFVRLEPLVAAQPMQHQQGMAPEVVELRVIQLVERVVCGQFIDARADFSAWMRALRDSRNG